ncbi:MAG: SIS domain-containing protein [Novipirellula sp. JB048]
MHDILAVSQANPLGSVVVSGVGKSGIIARKIAATLSSTGTRSLFLHPTEAFHGDLGVIGKADIFLAISNSGETEELLRLLPFLRENENIVLSITGNPSSRLAEASHLHLDAGVTQEACPLQLAPTASTMASMAMGDALAAALMKARSFEPENFARLHPGGSLGRRLLMKVADEMIADNLPYVAPEAKALDVIKVISNGTLGLAIVRHADGFGIVTDGDVRRAIESRGQQFFTTTATQMMSPNPIRVAPSMSIHEAINLMHRHQITSLMVCHDDDVVGVFKK